MTIQKNNKTSKCYWFKEGSMTLIVNMAGNLLPIYAMALMAFLKDDFNSTNLLKAAFQPYTLLVLSGAYLSLALYTSNQISKKNRAFLLFSIGLFITIGVLIREKKKLEDLTANDQILFTVLTIFIITFISFGFFHFRQHFILYSIAPSKNTKKVKDRILDNLNKLNNE